MPVKRQGSFASVYSSFAPPPPPGRPRPRSLAVEPPAPPLVTKDNDYVNVDDLQWEENSDALPEEWTQRFTRTQSRELTPDITQCKWLCRSVPESMGRFGHSTTGLPIGHTTYDSYVNGVGKLCEA